MKFILWFTLCYLLTNRTILADSEESEVWTYFQIEIIICFSKNKENLGIFFIHLSSIYLSIFFHF